jgi:hypothetical protein
MSIFELRHVIQTNGTSTASKAIVKKYTDDDMSMVLDFIEDQVSNVIVDSIRHRLVDYVCVFDNVNLVNKVSVLRGLR